MDKILKKEEVLVQDESGVERQLRETKAIKSDDADIPVHLWNERVKEHVNATIDRRVITACLDVIRNLFF